MLQVTATLCTAVSLLGGGRAVLFVRAARGPQSLPYSGSSTPSSRPFSIAWLCLSGKGTERDRERELESCHSVSV